MQHEMIKKLSQDLIFISMSPQSARSLDKSNSNTPEFKETPPPLIATPKLRASNKGYLKVEGIKSSESSAGITSNINLEGPRLKYGRVSQKEFTLDVISRLRHNFFDQILNKSACVNEGSLSEAFISLKLRLENEEEQKRFQEIRFINFFMT